MEGKKLEQMGRRGILYAYLLRSFSKGRKSGYDILREVEEKTAGRWKPGKGSVYPLITRMEQDGLLEVAETGARGVKKYALTAKGRQALKTVAEYARRRGEQFSALGGVMMEICGYEVDPELMAEVVKMRELMLVKGRGPRAGQVQGIVAKCAHELEKL